jgi:hypothetical protein
MIHPAVSTGFAGCLGLASALGLSAQQSLPNTLKAQRIGAALRLDGNLDKPEWARATPITNFTQRELNENQPVTERTQVAVLYTQTDLYLGIWCFDSEPGQIVAQKMKWDFEYGAEDNFIIVLDSYGDRRNAYQFVINPNGAQYDALIMDNNRKTNADWNGVWYVAAKRDGRGWFAEVRIPFSTLKFSSADVQKWGINFERNIRRKREQALWQGWSRDSSIVQVGRAGTLVGLEKVAQIGVFEFRPYVLAGVETGTELPRKTVQSAGLDFNYVVNPTVKLDFTVHPDFAQVESDDLIVNLSRFNMRIPEKRQFFLEAQNFFDFPLGQARPFYSRRIGKYQGLDTPILAGGRFLGKMDGSTLGLMLMQTEATSESRATNFSLLRYRQDLGDQSSIGVLGIGAAQSGRFNGTGGMDFLYSTRTLFGDKNFQAGGAFADTTTSDRENRTGSAQRLFVNYPNDLHEISGSWERVGQDFNPEVGFLSRTSYQLTTLKWRINPRPSSLAWVQKLQFKPLDVSYYIDDVTHRMQSVYTEFRPLAVFAKSGESLEINVQRNAEGLSEDFEIRPGHLIRAGNYWTNRVEVQVSTFDGRPLYATADINKGTFYDGTSTELGLQANWKPSKYYGMGLSYERTDISLPGGRFAIDQLVGRFNFSVNPRLFGAVFTQWNNDENRMLFNLRLTWIPRPGASLYFVLNQFGDTLEPHSVWRVKQTSAMVKFVWYFDRR